MTRVAAIDCGTNSIRLLVADIAAPRDGHAGGVSDVHREMRIVRLGEGVDRTGRLAPDALKRTLDAVHDYAAVATHLGARRVRMVATSATRDAQNSDEFVTGVHRALGVEPEIVTGMDEARLSFAGALSGLPSDVEPPVLVVDIGGGSTEFVLGSAGVEQATSVDVGCVRLTERYLHGDPPTVREVAAAEQAIDDAMVRVAGTVDVTRAESVVGLAGSVTTVAALALQLPQYDATFIHGARITETQVERVTEMLLHASRRERAALAVMHPGRVDVIAGGALVLRTIMRRWGIHHVVASEHDILDGIALSLLADQDG